MIKQIVLELQPTSFDVIRESVDVYHKYLHMAEYFDHDINISKKQIKRELIVCHRLRNEFDQILPPLESHHE